VVDADLEHQRRVDALVPAPAGDLVLERDRRAERVVEPVEGAHHPVPHRIDDAAAAADRLPDEIEMPADPAVGGRVAEPFVQPGGALQVAEQERDVADGELLAGSEHLGAEQVTELLQRGHLGRGGGLAGPGEFLDGAAGAVAADGEPPIAVGLAAATAIVGTAIVASAAHSAGWATAFPAGLPQNETSGPTRA